MIKSKWSIYNEWTILGFPLLILYWAEFMNPDTHLWQPWHSWMVGKNRLLIFLNRTEALAASIIIR